MRFTHFLLIIGVILAPWSLEAWAGTCSEASLRALPAAVRSEATALCSPEAEQRWDAVVHLETMSDDRAAAVVLLIDALGDGAIPMKEDPPGSKRFEFTRGTVVTGYRTVGYRAAEALAAIGESAREPLIAATRSPDPTVRRHAVYGLGKIATLPSNQPLVAAFKDTDVNVRLNALDALIAREDARAMDLLISGLQDENPRVRRRAADLLQSRPDPRAVAALVAAFERENKEDRRGAWRTEIAALGAIHDSRAVEALLAIVKARVPLWAAMLAKFGEAGVVGEEAPMLAMMAIGMEPVILEVLETLKTNRGPHIVAPAIRRLKDAEPFVRSTAGFLLLEIDDPRAAEPLAALLSDKSLVVQLVAVRAVGRWKPPGGATRIAGLIHDPSPLLRRQVVQALGGFTDPVAGEALAAAVHDSDPQVRSLAQAPLVALRTAQGAAALLPLLLEEDASLRTLAVRALGGFREPEAQEALIAALKDKTPEVRKAAAELLSGRADSRIAKEFIGLLGDNAYRMGEIINPVLSGSRDPEIIDSLFAAFDSTDSSISSRAMMILEKNDDPRIPPRLASVLAESKDRKKRLRVIWMLGRKKADGVLPLLATMRDPDREVREAVLRSLAMTGDPRVLEPLLSLLSDPVNADPAVRALAVLQDPRTINAAAALLATKDNQVRRKIVTLMGELKDPRSKEHLLRSLRTDQDDGVSGLAAAALQKIGGDDIVEPLIQALRSPQFGTRSEAAIALARVDGSRLDALYTEAVTSGAPKERAAVADALRLSTDPRAANALIRALQDESASVRASAALGLANKQAPGAFDLLIPSLRDPEREVREKASYTLHRLDEARLREPENLALFCAAKHENHPGAAEIERLTVALQHADAKVRSEATLRLGRFGDPQTLTPLLRAAGADPDIRVRSIAIGALGNFCNEGPRLLVVLSAALRDPDSTIKTQASIALGALQVPGVLETLEGCFKDREPSVRIGAVRALGSRRDKRTLPLLIEALRDVEPGIRSAAVLALENSRDPAAAEAIIPLVEDPAQPVVLAARGALLSLAGGGDYYWTAAQWRSWWERKKQDRR